MRFGQRSHGARGSRTMTVFVALLSLSPVMVAGAVTAVADVPTAPSASFNAACPGSTDSDPATTGSTGDLTRVSGHRLARYNAGETVVLYDASGANTLIPTPPVCAVHYDSSTGTPLAEWKFCIGSGFPRCLLEHVLVGAIVKLTRDQERIIAWLVHHGHGYRPSPGYQFAGVTRAMSGGSTDQRIALQHLVWCISDPNSFDDPAFVAMCAANLPVAEQQQILGIRPDPPTVDDDPVSVPARGLSLDLRVSRVIDVNADGVTDAGDEIEYGYALVNRGKVTLTGLGVSDPLIGAVICGSTTVSPARTVRCHQHAAYIVSAADTVATAVHNTASASATGPSGESVKSADDQAETRTQRSPLHPAGPDD